MGIEESWLSVLLLGSHVLLGGLNLLIVLTQTQILAFFALELKMSSYSDVPLLTFALSSKFTRRYCMDSCEASSNTTCFSSVKSYAKGSLFPVRILEPAKSTFEVLC
jgi:hypothetical protein